MDKFFQRGRILIDKNGFQVLWRPFFLLISAISAEMALCVSGHSTAGCGRINLLKTCLVCILKIIKISIFSKMNTYGKDQV